MKKILLALIMSLVATTSYATTGATLTTQAEHILWSELEQEGVNSKHYSEVRCLAENIYFEARAESFSGKAAVANVTRNRVLDKRWPSTFCEVVMEGPIRESWKTSGKDVPDSERVYWPRKHKCQFSWYCDGQKDVIWANYKNGQEIKGNARAWRESVQIAIYILEVGTMSIKDNTGGAVYYYAHNLVYPHWADSKKFIGVLGNHTFMK